MRLDIKPRYLKPPSWTVELDRRHPLARGLYFASLFEGGGIATDFVHNYASTPNGGITGSTGSVAGFGVGSKMAGAQFHNYTQLVADAAIIGPCSVLALVVVSPITGNSFFNKETGNGGSVNALEFRSDTGVGALQFVSPGGAVAGNGPTLTANIPQMIGYVDPANDGSTVGTYYLNGVPTVANNPHVRGTAPNSLQIGQRQDAGVSLTGTIFFGYIWGRALSSNEMLWLYKEPYAFFRPKASAVSVANTSAAAAAVLFRRSRSLLGTRVGSRQGTS